MIKIQGDQRSPPCEPVRHHRLSNTGQDQSNIAPGVSRAHIKGHLENSTLERPLRSTKLHPAAQRSASIMTFGTCFETESGRDSGASLTFAPQCSG